MSELLAGLLGVAIGSGLNGITVYALERRRDAQAALQATRLLLPEMLQVIHHLEGAAEVGEWGMVPGAPTARWRDYQPMLAPALSGDEWGALIVVYASLALFESEASDRTSAEALTDEDQEHLVLTLDVAKDAAASLAGRAKVPSSGPGVESSIMAFDPRSGSQAP